MREVIKTDLAPGAVGPYSQAIVAEGWVWVSGQIPIDPSTGVFVDGGVEEQAHQVLKNLSAVLTAAGSGLDRIVRATVYLVDMGDFSAVNGVYSQYFPEAPPARACVEVSALPKGARVEIDAVARVS